MPEPCRQTGGAGTGCGRGNKRGGVKTYFLYDGAAPVCEYSSTGTLLATNTFGADGLISRRANSITTFYTFDERGSVSQRLSSAGAVQSSDLYDGFGSRTSTGGADVWQFEAQVGYYTDSETGLILCTHRFYDPLTGRWLTRDPIGYDGGINLYGYVGNNPGNEDDPLGLSGDGLLPPGPTGGERLPPGYGPGWHHGTSTRGPYVDLTQKTQSRAKGTGLMKIHPVIGRITTGKTKTARAVAFLKFARSLGQARRRLDVIKIRQTQTRGQKIHAIQILR